MSMVKGFGSTGGFGLGAASLARMAEATTPSVRAFQEALGSAERSVNAFKVGIEQPKKITRKERRQMERSAAKRARRDAK